MVPFMGLIAVPLMPVAVGDGELRVLAAGDKRRGADEVEGLVLHGGSLLGQVGPPVSQTQCQNPQPR